MSKIAWSAPTDPGTVARRASGRRHYNAWRRFCAAIRRRKVANLLLRWGMDRGIQARIAAELDVSEATVSRDVGALLASPWKRCPLCGHEQAPALEGQHLSDLRPISWESVRE